MTANVSIGVDITSLRPTQMTVGLREVLAKRQTWRDADENKRSRLLRSHVIPTVLGAKQHHYIVDHHHFALALLDEEAGLVAVYVPADLSALSKSEFLTYLDNNAWCHAYDASGKRRDLQDIPKRLSRLKDDPYRSLAAALIRTGAVAKNERPFSEFIWADFLRRRVTQHHLEKDFDAAVGAATKIARSDRARSLPGWSAPHSGGL